MIANRQLLWIGASAAVLIAIAAWWGGRRMGSAAVGFLDDVFAGTVEGVGETVGIPRTDEAACARALAEGRYWEASFVCPAGAFIRGVIAPPVIVATNPVDLAEADFLLN